MNPSPLPTKEHLLQKMISIGGISLGDNFTDLRECSESYKKSYITAWKAIEQGNLESLEVAIKAMKERVESSSRSDKCLDVCYLQCIVSKHSGMAVHYYMTLLAHAASKKEMKMVETLIRNGASLQMGSAVSGIPLSQFLVHSWHQDSTEMIDNEIAKLLVINNVLNDNFLSFAGYQSEDSLSDHLFTPLELAIKIKKFELAKFMVYNGASPTHIALNLRKAIGMIPVLQEYYEFGTNHIISWILNEYSIENPHYASKFIKEVVESDALSLKATEMFEAVGRHPAHAFLTCGHEDLINALIQFYGPSVMMKSDSDGRNAIQIVAAQGNLESVKILMKQVQNHSDKLKEGTPDLTLAVLAAAKYEHLEVVMHLMESDSSILKNSELWKHAVEQQLSVLFKALHHVDPFQIVRDFQFADQFTTFGHIAAHNGKTKLFKVIFPLKFGSALKDVNDVPALVKGRKNGCSMFAALMVEDKQKKTPLHIAIEKHDINILRVLKEHIVERDSKPSAEQCKERKEWNAFWDMLGPQLLLHACQHGSVDIVTFMVSELNCKLLQSSDTDASASLTPLSCAAKYGKHHIVNYLLKFVSPKAKNPQHSPLLLAAANGHTKCVRYLLRNGADVHDELNMKNCLVLAIERKHRETALAIVSDEMQGLKALQFYKNKYNETSTPMRMLIKDMPDIAEWVLNKCALSRAPVESVTKDDSEHDEKTSTVDNQQENSEITHTVDNQGVQNTEYVMHNRFELIDDHQSWVSPGLALIGKWGKGLVDHISTKCTCTKNDSEPGETEMGSLSRSQQYPAHDDRKATKKNTWGPQYYDTLYHPVAMMVQYKRETLLNHPLIEEWIKYKWYRVGIPGLIINLATYVAFLTLLTVFAVLLPRPGSLNNNCYIGNLTQNNNVSMNDSRTGSDSCTVSGSSVVVFLYTASIFVILFSIWYLFLEAVQLVNRKWRFALEFENWLQIPLFVLCIIFVIPVGHGCWCFPAWRWQIGAVVVFLAWVNFILLLRYVPAIGHPTVMLFNVYFNFVTLVYLPIFLILTFAIPFYMLFVRNSTLEGESSLLDYASVLTAIRRVSLQTVGEFEAGGILTDTSLLYPFLSLLLFVIFIIAMPVLFNNFLIGVAVGEIGDQRKVASSLVIKYKVSSIFEVERTLPNLRFLSVVKDDHGKKASNEGKEKLENESDDVDNQSELREKTKRFISDIKIRAQTQEVKLGVKELVQQLTQSQEVMRRLNEEIILSKQLLSELQLKTHNEIKESLNGLTEAVKLKAVSDK